MAIEDDIAAYEPANEQEEIDKQVILSVLGTRENAFSWREAPAKSIVVSPDCAQTLLVFHNIYGSWSWIGGHADGLSRPLSSHFFRRKRACRTRAW